MTTWITDAKNNRCSVEYWGSTEAAQKALDSLIDCEDCTNCSDCSGCSYCSDCSDCSLCSRCSDCSGCSNKAGITDDFAPPTIPIIPDIHQRLYAAVTETPTSLAMDDWHSCNTTHCRAGHIVHMAGEAGYALERFHNTALAAMLIYDASDPTFKINPCRFYDSNDDAMADMKRLAREAQKTAEGWQDAAAEEWNRRADPFKESAT